jgi:hypothetical protein
MDFRDYDPAIARWTGIDPVTHHNMSPYMAFDGNPVFWADPSGADAYDMAMALFNNSRSGMTQYSPTGNGGFQQSGYIPDEFFKDSSLFEGLDGGAILKGGTYNGQNFNSIGKNLSFFEKIVNHINMYSFEISKIKIEHSDFVGKDGEYANIRDGASQQAKSLKLMAGLLGISDTKILKGELSIKSGAGGIFGAYLYLQSMSFSDDVKTINSIKDSYDDIGGNKGVYMIYRETFQGTRVGTTLITMQLDVYDVSTAKFLGKIFHSY